MPRLSAEGISGLQAGEDANLEDVLQLLEAMTPILPSERVDLAAASARVLARPFFAPFDLPAFGRAAMDGYAVRAADVAGAGAAQPKTLHIVDEVLAGATATPLVPGAACRIATGAAMPAGADAVLRQEDVLVSAAGELTTTQPVAVGKDVLAAGCHARRGQSLLPAGWHLGANDLALLAAFGATEVDVSRRPQVAYVETGSELAEPGQVLAAGHIYASNNLMLSLRAQEHGAHVVGRHRVADDADRMADLFNQLLNEADLVVSTGGVSVGPRDLVPDVLAAIGCRQLFRGLPIRPGQPVMAAHRQGKLWLGLPGNPTAALVTHEFFVRPILWRMGGIHFAQGFNPSYMTAAAEPAPAGQSRHRRGSPRISLYLGRLQANGGQETVHVDHQRWSSAVPAPFAFNALVRVDPPAPATTQVQTSTPAGVAASAQPQVAAPGAALAHPAQVRVYPADRATAVLRLTEFPRPVGGILLAGGQSRRMGHSKLFLPLAGIPLIVRAYRTLAALCAQVRVIGAPPDAVDLLARWEGEGVRQACFPDEYPAAGPLGGLITGLHHTSEPTALVLAADLPTVDGPTLRRLLAAARAKIGPKSDAESPPSPTTDYVSVDGAKLPPAHAFVLAHGDERQPLAGLYPAKRTLAAAEQLWRRGGRSVNQLVDLLGADPVATEQPLLNVNHPADYRAARALFGAGDRAWAAPGPASDPRSGTMPRRPGPGTGAAAALPPLLAFSGFSGSGKTTLIQRLIPLLKERGLRVVVIKHSGGFELDQPGKDSWLFRQAGADGILLLSAAELAYMVRPQGEPTLAELVHLVGGGGDVILVEGFKAWPLPKVVMLGPDEDWADHPLALDPHVQAIYGGRAAEAAAGPPPAPPILFRAVAADDGTPIPVFPRTPPDGDDTALPWLLDWVMRRLVIKQ